jgi:hypothetical protein
LKQVNYIKAVVLLVVCQFALGSFATQPSSLEGKGQSSGQESRQMSNVDDRLNVLSQRLNLSQDQRAGFKDILNDQQVQMEAVRQDGSLSQEDRDNKLRALRDAGSSKMRALLNDDQKKTYEALQQEMSERMGQGQGRGQGGGSPSGHGQGEGRPTVAEHLKSLTERLNLSSDQQARIKVILEEQRVQMQAIWQDTSLSREDKTSRAQTVREAANSKMRVVLTDEQRKKFDAIL